MIGVIRCAEGWCESVISWDFRGFAFVAVAGLFALWLVRRG